MVTIAIIISVLVIVFFIARRQRVKKHYSGEGHLEPPKEPKKPIDTDS